MQFPVDKNTIPESPPFRSVDRHLREVSANDIELYPHHSDPATSSISWDTSQGDEVHFILSQESAAGADTQEAYSSPRVSHVRSDETDIGDTSTIFSSPPHKTSFYSSTSNLTYTPQSASSEPQRVAMNSHKQTPVVVVPTLHSTSTTSPSIIRLPTNTILPLDTHSISLDTVGTLVAPLSLVSSSASQPTSSLFSVAPIRTLRRRRDVQLRPFTVEKERYRASISRNISELADLDEVRDESQHHRRKRGRKSGSTESDHYSGDSHNYGNVSDIDRPPMEELKGKGSWNPARGATHDGGEIANVYGKENQMPARASLREGTMEGREQITQSVDRRQSSRKRNNDGIPQDDSGISANVIEPRIRRSRVIYRASTSGDRSDTKRPMAQDANSIALSSQPMASPSIQNCALDGNKSTGASRVDEELLKWREELENDDELDIARETGPLVSKKLSPLSISVGGFHSNMSDTDNGLDEVASPFAQECTEHRHGDYYSDDLSQDKESDDNNAITIHPTRRRIVQYRNGHKRVTKARDVNAKRLKGALPASFVTLNRDALERESQNNTEHIPYHRSRTPSDQASSPSRSSSTSPDMRLPSLPPPLLHRTGNAYNSQRILGDRSTGALLLTLASNDIFTDEENDGNQSQESDREDSPNYMGTMRSLSPSLAKYQSVDSSDEGDADTLRESDLIDRMVTRRSIGTTKRKSREVNSSRKNISQKAADKLLRKRPYSEHSRGRQSTVTIGKDTQTTLDDDDRVLTNLSGLSPDCQSISDSETNSNIEYINAEIVSGDMARDDRIWLESDTDSVDNKEAPTSSPRQPTELRTMTRALSMKLKSKSKSRLRPRSSNRLFKPPQQKSLKTFLTTDVQRNRMIRRTTFMKHSRMSSSMSHQRFKPSASHVTGRFDETAKNLPPRNTEASGTVINGMTEIGSNGLTMSTIQHTAITSRKPRWAFMDDPHSSGLPDEQQAGWVAAMMKNHINAREKIGTISRNEALNKSNTYVGIYNIRDLDNRNVERRIHDIHDSLENTEPTSLTELDKNEFPENRSGVSWIDKKHRSLKSNQHIVVGDSNDDLEITRNGADHATQLRNERRQKQKNLSRVAVEHSHSRMSFEKPLHVTSEQIPIHAIKRHQSSSSRRPLGYSADSNYESTKFNQPPELLHPSLRTGSTTPKHHGGISECSIGWFSFSDFLSRQNELSGDFGVCPIPGGIYFGRNTYIGRGSLKTLIRQPHALYSLGNGNQIDSFSDIVGNGAMRIFDSQITLATSWQEIASLLPKLFYQVMDNTMSILQSDRRGLNEASQSYNVEMEDSVKESLALECIEVVDSVTTFITYRVPFLSVADRTKFKSVLAIESACLWRRFKAMFDSDIFYQNGNHLDQFHSYRLAIRLCCRFVDWAARLSLMECTVDHEELSVHSQSKELMRLLLRSGSFGIQRALRRCLVAAVVEDALLEGWVLLINIMDRYASTWRLCENGSDDQQHSSVEESSFWTILNELLIEEPVVDTNVDPWSRSEQAWGLLFAILPLYQFDVNFDGVSNAQPDGIGNWSFVEKLLRASFVPLDDVRSMTIMQQITYDRYVKVLFHRCHTLVLSWSWRADREILKPLYKFFECRKFKDLLFEEDASFPKFFQNFTGEIPPKISSSDTCFHIFLKILYITFDRECSDLERMETNISTKRSQALRKLLSQLSPTHVMTLKERPDENAGGMVLSPGGHSYTSLGNQYNLILLMAHAIPSGIWPRSITQMKSFLKFEDSDLISRRIFFEAFALLAIIYKHHDDPLKDILDYMNEKLIYICAEYLEHEKGRNIAVIPSPFHNIRKAGTLDKYVNGLQTQEARTLLDSSQKELLQLIETVFKYYTKILQAPATKAMSTIWPDASFLNQGKILKHWHGVFYVIVKLQA